VVVRFFNVLLDSGCADVASRAEKIAINHQIVVLSSYDKIKHNVKA
jgi:hypothetical protein